MFNNNWTGFLSFFVFLLLAVPSDAFPKRKGNGNNAATGNTGAAKGNGAAKGAAAGAATGAAAAGGISLATDGSTILDKTVTINGLEIRYKISAPADQFTAESGVTGAAATAGANGTAGLNVLLHGDGGQSFFDFPNQDVQNNLMGVVVLAPDPNLFWGGGSGLDRTDGVAHSAAVNTLIQQQLSQDVAFDPANVFFTGVSGGSLMLSGFFVPAFGAQYQTGVELNCGALSPQVPVVDAATMIANTKIHFQSTQDELALLQDAIPQAVAAYEKLATGAGLDAATIGTLQTVDNTPNGGGHCGFDGKGFVSGVQLMATNYANVMGDNASGDIAGIGNVLTSVVGNENVQFSSAT
ncbi:hypothetical protein GLAREA_03745 [Glarea lozoyensis ATCC 20868]|uniref:Alpha/beta-Hydrolase n=1 Tax=Glarea lozoyensis (strain ATCC 20868 / MF5171) TaxID=1116229 RepID=S3DWP3_GLAL2|nr:uncharacterized protein GLAREA_03745 [Glarea lozoyensis ATCC 20868]EPE30778.1 hypothetical protein GLAREA_03745 [Glarea lozoyensis ATCC 20868]